MSAAVIASLDRMPVGGIEALERPPVRQASKGDQGLHPHRPVDRAALGKVGDLARELAGPDLGRGPPGVMHPARFRRAEIGEHPQQCRLARTIGPDQADHLAAAHGQIDAFQQRDRTKAYGNALRLDLHHAASSRIR